MNAGAAFVIFVGFVAVLLLCDPFTVKARLRRLEGGGAPIGDAERLAAVEAEINLLTQLIRTQHTHIERDALRELVREAAVLRSRLKLPDKPKAEPSK